MDARWIPVLAAALGVLGGVGGAAIGGSIANEGQQQRFEGERLHQLQDLLIDTYSRYVRTAASAYVEFQGEVSEAERISLFAEVGPDQA